MGTESDLIRRIQQGEIKDLKIFFESFYPQACRLARKYLNDKDLSQNMAQDSFLGFWMKINELQNWIKECHENETLYHRIKSSSRFKEWESEYDYKTSEYDWNKFNTAVQNQKTILDELALKNKWFTEIEKTI